VLIWWWLPFTTETVHIFGSGYFDYEGAFQTVVDSYYCNGLKIAENEVLQILQFSEGAVALF